MSSLHVFSRIFSTCECSYSWVYNYFTRRPDMPNVHVCVQVILFAIKPIAPWWAQNSLPPSTLNGLTVAALVSIWTATSWHVNTVGTFYTALCVVHDRNLHINLYCQLRARRALMRVKDVLLRTSRVLLLYKVYGDRAFWFSMEHRWTALTPFWLATDDIIMHTSLILTTIIIFILAYMYVGYYY